MKNRNISYEMLVSGLLLKFGSVDTTDISVMMDMMGIENFSSIGQDDVFKYIKRNDDNRFVFNLDMIKRNYEVSEDFYLVMKKFQGRYIKNFLENIDLFEYVLRNIKLLDKVMVDNYKFDFSDIQIFVINELKNRKYLNDYWYDYSDVCLCTMLTLWGDLYLFKIDYSDAIEKFSKKLRDNGYNDKLLDVYLVSPHRYDLGREYIEDRIMNIDSFLEFCLIYGIAPCLKNDIVNLDGDKHIKVKSL